MDPPILMIAMQRGAIDQKTDPLPFAFLVARRLVGITKRGKAYWDGRIHTALSGEKAEEDEDG